jgi:2-keto-4-pentenoate hydratase/2-oxohepta-3-ene-1,7-dioic acid hydratase in catechol pathway
MIIRNIWCVGRNFNGHVKELSNEAPTRPFIFLKAGSSATVNSREIHLPSWCEEVHHEVELALKFDGNLQIKEAAVALDLTERKVQSLLRQKGLCWTLAKSFDEACPVSAFFRVTRLEDLQTKTLRLWVNDELRQEAPLSQMNFPLAYLIEFVTQFFPVCAHDLLLTGTPAGVGSLKVGDQVKAQIEGEITHLWTVFQEPRDPKAPCPI